MGVVKLFIYLWVGVITFIYLFIGVITLFIYGRGWLLYLLIYFSLFFKKLLFYIYIYYKHYKLKYFHAENLILKTYFVLYCNKD